ncbi:hypothetical protein E2C00_01845 [Streptomyces sp. WAC05374]|uniref:DUF6223 family protein n=1 Tax=Streptomyces sp. WAC05374 TaxID=2487420 RepID=UPI000F8645F3|nr:DUF6223 family protein [Streptomyces sp. WAC05374]RST12602.1 hypothetical protein EF905_22300 [Streptomyces sp. WAC05374]TDF50276.1 hypothetical protein E2B92_01820 [Streptomyces sp. WAC05374]TDF58000.1 hypothetical protein E2C02_09610 [Streptomyces sp. WAC05374]TDF60529.1 hypothetical protein E2C00_01845 [Streptomyces sp. WAC05374]
MSVRVLFAAAPAAAPAPFQVAAADVYAMGAGRLTALVAALVGLVGVAAGGLALARSTGRPRIGSGRSRALTAVVAGLTGAALGGLVVATAEGGLGTGNGLGGGVVAMMTGLAGSVLGWLALTRTRRTG